MANSSSKGPKMPHRYAKPLGLNTFEFLGPGMLRISLAYSVSCLCFRSLFSASTSTCQASHLTASAVFDSAKDVSRHQLWRVASFDPPSAGSSRSLWHHVEAAPNLPWVANNERSQGSKIPWHPGGMRSRAAVCRLRTGCIQGGE